MAIVETKGVGDYGELLVMTGVAAERFYCMMSTYPSDRPLLDIFSPCTHYDDHSLKVVKLVTVDRCSP